MTTQPELFEVLQTCTIAAREGSCPNHPGLPQKVQRSKGLELRDAALAQSQRGREERIQAVRDYLLFPMWQRQDEGRGTLTGDDVMDAVEALGFMDGDHRWVGNVLKGWDAVTPTVNFVPSRRKERHGAPLRVWRWK